MDLVIRGDICDVEPTTVINLIDSIPEVMRHGNGQLLGFVGQEYSVGI